jgi:prophage antirepressor-like protein
VSSIIPFSFEKHQVRVVPGASGEGRFVAADVCDAIGIKDTSNAISRLDDDERGTHTVRTPSGDQQMLTINESGLYSLILTSRKPEAKRFKKWVTSEVLPSIRKTGAYLTPGVTLASLPPALARQIGGISKSVVHKQIVTILQLELPRLLQDELAKQRVSVRNGVTAGQVWALHGLPALKNGAQMLSLCLVNSSCHIEGGGGLGGIIENERSDRQ